MIDVDRPRSGVHHCVLAVDIVGYSGMLVPEHEEAQRRLVAILTESSAEAGTPIDQWHLQASGDGMLAVLPAGLSETTFIPAFVMALGPALDRHNTGDRPTLRLRVAIHHGYVEWAPNGWSDDTVIEVGRMCDATETRAALTDHPDSTFVLAISPRIHHDIVVRRRLLDPATFWSATLTSKDRQLPAWLHVPVRRTQPPTAPTAAGRSRRWAVSTFASAILVAAVTTVLVWPRGHDNHAAASGPAPSASQPSEPARAAAAPLAIDASPSALGYAAPVTGTGSIPDGYQLWIMVRVTGGSRFWLSATSHAAVTADNRWLSSCIYFGTPAVDPGSHGNFTIYAVLVPQDQVDPMIIKAPTYQDGYLLSLPASAHYVSATWTRNDDLSTC